MSLMDYCSSSGDPVYGLSGLSEEYWPLEREKERSTLYNAVIGFTNVFQLSLQVFLLLLHYLLLTRTAASSSWVVAHPELDGEVQKRRQGIMVNDTKLVAVMHYRVCIYNILKFLFSYSEPDNLRFVKLFWINRHLFLLIDFSIDRGGGFKVSEYGFSFGLTFNQC